jgi:hypothetical protein
MTPEEAAKQIGTQLLQNMPKSDSGGFWNWDEVTQSIRTNSTGVVGSKVIIVLAEMGLMWPVHLLLEKGSNVNVQSNAGGTALMVATWQKHYAIVRLLIQNGANAKLHLTNSPTALARCWAAADCPLDIKQFLERS